MTQNFKKIKVGDLKIGSEEKNAIIQVLSSGRITEGEKVAIFEKEWAAFVGTEYCIATSSGAGALMVGLTALKYKYKLPPKTKAITSALTYIADASAASMTGFEPIFTDIDPATFCMTAETLETRIKDMKKFSGPAVVIPVDLMGYPVKIDEISKVAKKYNLLVFEDAAEAEGSIYKGKPVGSQGLINTFSFYIAHNLQAGELGAITTNDVELYRLSRKIKAQGRACECLRCTRATGYCPGILSHKGEDDYDPRFSHELIGYNFKPMEFQAAIALTQFKKIEWIIERRKQNVRYLNQGLEDLSDILQLPFYSEDVSYLAYPIVIKKPQRVSRKFIRKRLEEFGIETRPLFGCIPTQQPAYAHLKKKYTGKLPHAEYIGLQGFYIACHQYLKNSELDYIIQSFHKILKNYD